MRRVMSKAKRKRKRPRPPVPMERGGPAGRKRRYRTILFGGRGCPPAHVPLHVKGPFPRGLSPFEVRHSTRLHGKEEPRLDRGSCTGEERRSGIPSTPIPGGRRDLFHVV